MRIPLMTAVLAAFPFAAQAEMARYELDPAHTAVFFTVDHVGYAKTLGIFGTVQGRFAYDMDTQDLSDVEVTIDAASVTTFHEARDGHVKNGDFLDVANHPEISFVADGGTATSDTGGTVTGDLTILGMTQPVTLNVKLNKAAEYPFGHKRFTLGLSIEASVMRSDFGMMYAVENGLVGDEVQIMIETEAMRMD